MSTARELLVLFSGQVVAHMRARRVRQWMLAEAAGMAPGRVSDVLKGRYPDARLSTLCRIADAAGCDLDISVKPRTQREA